jgi:hypothetical protein
MEMWVGSVILEICCFFDEGEPTTPSCNSVDNLCIQDAFVRGAR